MEIIQVPIEKLKRDEEQPRQTFDQDQIKGMAKSIKTEGVINPVEVDKNFIIITGEMRWRASKLAGLKTIPCKVLDINSDERFRRQVIENIHHNTMNDWDTAKALQKLLNLVPRTRIAGKDAGISRLAEEIGKSANYISQHLDRLEDSAPMQKALREGKISFTHARELQEVLLAFRPIMERKILAGEFRKSNAVSEIKAALNRNPERAEEILAIDYTPYKSTAEVIEIVTKISPRAQEIVKARLQPAADLLKIKDSLLDWLQNNPPQKIVYKDRMLTILAMSTIVDKLNEWGKVANSVKLINQERE